MATSAPKVLLFDAHRLKTDQLWLQYYIRINGVPADARGMGFGIEADSPTRSMVPTALPVDIVGDYFDVVEVKTQTPAAAGLGSLATRSSLIFDLRTYMAGDAGQITLSTTTLTVDWKRTNDEIYNEGGLYPEVFVINILTDIEPEDIEGTLQWPGLTTAGFTKVVPLANMGALAALPNPVRDTFYNLAATQTIDNKEYPAGLYFRSTTGTLIPLSTTILPLPA